MKNRSSLLLALLPILAITIASCGQKPTEQPTEQPSVEQPSTSVDKPSTSVDQPTSEEDISFPEISQEIDHTDLIPPEVLNADVDIDFVVYIEGQNGRIPDIGNYSNDPTDTSRKYHPKDITSIEMAKYFGAAAAFKVLAPKVRINLQYCSIADYPELIREYNNQKGHLPQLMWGTDHVVEMLGIGYNHDVSEYSGSEYYEQYNEYFMSRFNFGGFQAGLPIAAEPWGVFVNLNNLEEYKIVSDTVADGECTDEYKEWVDNFTWANFVDAARKSTTDTHAGLSRVVEYFTSYSVESINASFIKDGTVDLSSEEVLSTIQKLLEYEQELSKYCVYQYNDVSFGSNLIAKDYYTNAAAWRGVENFVKDQYHTFYAEAPWSLTTISQYVNGHNEKAEKDSTIVPLDTKVDFLPYPKVDEDSNAYTGIAVEGLTVGNLCPVGEKDALPHCYSKNARLEMEVAAYFAMFMGLDPRSIESQANVKYVFDGTDYTGHLSLPLTKRNIKFEWQETGEIEDKLPDPAKDFDDNWQYQLALWLDVYDLYLTNDEPADVNYFSNITYGLVQMLDSIYMLDGIGDDYVTCLNYWNEPVNIPDGGDIKDIFDRWQGRFTRFRNEETNDGVLGTSGYVAAVLANLADVQTEINDNSATAWSFLQECVDTYYFDEYYNSMYDVLDKSYRNEYEGSLYY